MTATSDGGWVTQQARNLLLVLEERGRRLRYLLRDRDTKFYRAFDDLVRCEGAQILLTPVQAPNANAYAERWIRTVRAGCLDWLLIVGQGHLAQVLRGYVQHYNQHRPHRALGLEAPDPPTELNAAKDRQGKECRRDLLAAAPRAPASCVTAFAHPTRHAERGSRLGAATGTPPRRCAAG